DQESSRDSGDELAELWMLAGLPAVEQLVQPAPRRARKEFERLAPSRGQRPASRVPRPPGESERRELVGNSDDPRLLDVPPDGDRREIDPKIAVELGQEQALGGGQVEPGALGEALDHASAGLPPGQLREGYGRTRSIAAMITSASGSTCGRKRPTISPAGEMRNFSKFHATSPA